MPREATVPVYPDGIVRIYRLANSAGAGGMPNASLTLAETLPYRRKTVGVTRFFNGLQADYTIDNRIRTPRRDGVTTQDVAETHDGKRYWIRQVQYPEDIIPPCMDLALERQASTDEVI